MKKGKFKKLKKRITELAYIVDEILETNLDLIRTIKRYENMVSEKDELFERTDKAAGILMERNRELMKSNQALSNRIGDLLDQNHELEDRLEKIELRADYPTEIPDPDIVK